MTAVKSTIRHTLTIIDPASEYNYGTKVLSVSRLKAVVLGRAMLELHDGLTRRRKECRAVLNGIAEVPMAIS